MHARPLVWLVIVGDVIVAVVTSIIVIVIGFILQHNVYFFILFSFTIHCYYHYFHHHSYTSFLFIFPLKDSLLDLLPLVSGHNDRKQAFSRLS